VLHIMMGDSDKIVISESGGYNDPYNLYENVQSTLTDNEVDITGRQSGRQGRFGFNHSGEGELDVMVPPLASIEVISNVGDIIIDGISGQVRATTARGNIQMLQGNLSGSSVLHTVDGDIEFDGALNPEGNYTLEADHGSVQAILPTNATFSLQTSGDFDEINNNFASDTMEDTSQPDLTISVNDGSIYIEKAGS
jgi:hypothetical protein